MPILICSFPRRFFSVLISSSSFLLYAFRFLIGSIRFYSPLFHFASVPCQFDSHRLIAPPSHIYSARFIPNSNRRHFESIQCFSNSARFGAILFQINSNLLHLKAIRGISIPFRFFPHQCVSAPAQIRSVPLHSFSILIVSVRRVSVSTRNFSCLFRFFSGRVDSFPILLGALQRLSIPYRIASDQFHLRSSLLHAFPDRRGSFALSALPSQVFSFSNWSLNI